MKVRVKALSVLDGKIYLGELTIAHAASSYGQPVLVLDGIGAVDSCWYDVHNVDWKPDPPKVIGGNV